MFILHTPKLQLPAGNNFYGKLKNIRVRAIFHTVNRRIHTGGEVPGSIPSNMGFVVDKVAPGRVFSSIPIFFLWRYGPNLGLGLPP
jgi:hypothetical protein